MPYTAIEYVGCQWLTTKKQRKGIGRSRKIKIKKWGMTFDFLLLFLILDSSNFVSFSFFLLELSNQKFVFNFSTLSFFWLSVGMPSPWNHPFLSLPQHTIKQLLPPPTYKNLLVRVSLFSSGQIFKKTRPVTRNKMLLQDTVPPVVHHSLLPKGDADRTSVSINRQSSKNKLYHGGAPHNPHV
jgi:hypothetical protein